MNLLGWWEEGEWGEGLLVEREDDNEDEWTAMMQRGGTQ